MAIIEGEKKRIYKKVTTKSMTAVRMSLLDINVRDVVDALVCLFRRFMSLLQLVLDPETLSVGGIWAFKYTFSITSGSWGAFSSRGSPSSSFCLISSSLFLCASRRLFLRLPSTDEFRSSSMWLEGGSALALVRIVAWRKLSDLLIFLALTKWNIIELLISILWLK